MYTEQNREKKNDRNFQKTWKRGIWKKMRNNG